ncbi:hypothetical protein EVAR_59121_1 [Eumeta japonica]|uniref:Uncharacterized protein n=1 Tax=Eumeta variegata TaxID=151549 RepID=A0A4C1ZL07_EUMVA|nr:hypothetical protein EVAR_59121_1 [Eumeta japonica]
MVPTDRRDQLDAGPAPPAPPAPPSVGTRFPEINRVSKRTTEVKPPGAGYAGLVNVQARSIKHIVRLAVFPSPVQGWWLHRGRHKRTLNRRDKATASTTTQPLPNIFRAPVV